MVARRPITPAPTGVIFNPRIRPATAHPRTAAPTPTGTHNIPPVNLTPRSQSITAAALPATSPDLSLPSHETLRFVPASPAPKAAVLTASNNTPAATQQPPPRTLAQRRITPSRIPIIPLSGVTYRPPKRKPVPPPHSATSTRTQAPTTTMTSLENTDPASNTLKNTHLEAAKISDDLSVDSKPNRRSWHPLDSDSPVIRDFGLRHSMQDLTNTREPNDEDAIITQEDFDELPGTDHSLGSRHPQRFMANRVQVNVTRPEVGDRRETALSFREEEGVVRVGSGRGRAASPVPGRRRPKTVVERVRKFENGGR